LRSGLYSPDQTDGLSLERFQEKLHGFSGSKARPNKDPERFAVSFET